MKIYISHSRNFTFKTDLYQPLQDSKLSLKHAFFFPHEDERSMNTQKEIQDSDLVVAEVSYPSTGQGIELGWASAAQVPIVCVSKEGSKVSGSLQYITKDFITYTDAEDLVLKLTQFLDK